MCHSEHTLRCLTIHIDLFIWQDFYPEWFTVHSRFTRVPGNRTRDLDVACMCSTSWVMCLERETAVIELNTSTAKKPQTALTGIMKSLLRPWRYMTGDDGSEETTEDASQSQSSTTGTIILTLDVSALSSGLSGDGLCLAQDVQSLSAQNPLHQRLYTKSIRT